MKKGKAAKLATIAGLGKVGPKKKKTDVLSVEGHNALVNGIVERQRQLESLKTEQDLALEELREIGISYMREQESRQFAKTCRVKGDKQDVRVTRKDAFSKIDIDHKDDLGDILGDLFQTLFQQGIDLKLTSTPEKFIADARKQGFRFDHHFDRTDWIKPKKGFLELRAGLRATLKAGDNEVIDALTDQFAYKASVGYKG